MYNKQVENALSEFVNTTEKHFGNHGYAAGYLVATIAQFFDKLSEKDQGFLMAQIQNTTEMYKGE